MPAQLIGAHMPTGKGLGAAVRAGKAIGCTAIQVFTSSPQQWKAKEITVPMVEDFVRAKAETGIDSVVSHDSYLIRLCSEDAELTEKSKAALLGEMQRCAAYGIGFVVSHIGSHNGRGIEKVLPQAAESIKQVLGAAPEGVMLLMETTAGQGSSLNYQFEQIAWLLEAVDMPSLGVCLDTCHIFAAGYDIRDEATFKAAFDHFDKVVGFQNLKCVHCNDSKKGLGSRVDRHENLGDGEIGPKAFQLLVTDPRFENIPILIETPDADTHHAINVQRLWDWSKS